MHLTKKYFIKKLKNTKASSRTLSRYLKANVKSTLSRIYTTFLKSALSRDLIKNLKAANKAKIKKKKTPELKYFKTLKVR